MEGRESIAKGKGSHSLKMSNGADVPDEAISEQMANLGQRRCAGVGGCCCCCRKC